MSLEVSQGSECARISCVVPEDDRRLRPLTPQAAAAQPSDESSEISKTTQRPLYRHIVWSAVVVPAHSTKSTAPRRALRADHLRTQEYATMIVGRKNSRKCVTLILFWNFQTCSVWCSIRHKRQAGVLSAAFSLKHAASMRKAFGSKQDAEARASQKLP